MRLWDALGLQTRHALACGPAPARLKTACYRMDGPQPNARVAPTFRTDYGAFLKVRGVVY
jgi:hypothetical protein